MYTRVITIFLLTTMFINLGVSIGIAQSDLVIVVTFSYLEPDVEKITCGGSIHPLVAPGVDPHEYQLRPGDIELLEKADLIISTGHTLFEEKIEEMINKSEIKTRLLDITEIPGTVIYRNPVTGRENLHGVIREPLNNLLFLSELTRVLIEIDPGRRECYLDKFYNTTRRFLSEVFTTRGVYRGDVLIDTPHIQYVVEWLGFNVKWIVKYEEEYQLTTRDIEVIKEMVKSSNIVAVFVTTPIEYPESKLLRELAAENNIPVIEIPGEVERIGVFELFKETISKLNNTKLREGALTPTVTTPQPTPRPLLDPVIAVSIVTSFAVGILVGFIVYRIVYRKRH